MAKNQSQAELIVQMEVNAILQEKVNRELEDKVRERTAEIELQKEEIVSQSEEITVQRDLLFAQKKELTDSMEYARHIQQALLGSSHTISGTGLRHFIFYKPKDIVSGDFYWFKQVKNYLYFAAADCTGHGVPGAFMSILGVSMLNEIVGKRDMNQPSFVLNELRKKLKKSLNQDAESRSKDGMDITLGFLNLESLRLQFAGAFNPLVLVRNNELIEYLTDRMPVGVHPKDANSFTHNELQLMTGDQLFVFSDGYLSQFGGDKGKKLNKSHFKDILLDISSREPGDQMAILGERLEQWQGNYDQIDDILVIGIKI
jgi:serine phosphatase RsbU (regulator of sigma subunit)